MFSPGVDPGYRNVEGAQPLMGGEEFQAVKNMTREKETHLCHRCKRRGMRAFLRGFFFGGGGHKDPNHPVAVAGRGGSGTPAPPPRVRKGM